MGYLGYDIALIALTEDPLLNLPSPVFFFLCRYCMLLSFVGLWVSSVSCQHLSEPIFPLASFLAMSPVGYALPAVTLPTPASESRFFLGLEREDSLPSASFTPIFRINN